MKGEIQFSVALNVTVEDLELLQRVVSHYQQTHPASSGSVGEMAETLRTLIARARRTADLLSANAVPATDAVAEIAPPDFSPPGMPVIASPPSQILMEGTDG